LNRSAANIPNACRIAIIVLNDAMILSYDANLGRMEFSEGTVLFIVDVARKEGTQAAHTLALFLFVLVTAKYLLPKFAVLSLPVAAIAAATLPRGRSRAIIP
jgi:hypothetical protein